jgi:hypothetical protein
VSDLSGEDVVGYSFTITYDAAVLTITGTDEEGTLSEEAVVVSNTQNPGEIRVSVASANALEGDGAIINLTADVIAVGTSDLSFTDFMFNEGDPDYTLAYGSLTAMASTDTEPTGTLPGEFMLKGNYPNPFNPVTTIQIDLPQSALVAVSVLDILGREVVSIPAQRLQAGANHAIRVEASGLPSGIYLYRVTARTTNSLAVKTGTMTLLK